MADRPNILFIMTDERRADAVGCSGGWQMKVIAPNVIVCGFTALTTPATVSVVCDRALRGNALAPRACCSRVRMA